MCSPVAIRVVRGFEFLGFAIKLLGDPEMPGRNIGSVAYLRKCICSVVKLLTRALLGEF